MATINMGPGTYSIPLSMFKDNRERVMDGVRLKTDVCDSNIFVLLEGGKDKSLYNTDVDYVFRQESFFQYFFGVREPGCYGAINVFTKFTTLFVPRLAEEYATWMGHLWTLAEYKERYEVDEVRYTDEIDAFFAEKKPSKILVLNGVNSDSNLEFMPPTFPGIEKYNIDKKTLYPIAVQCRVIKSPAELEVLRYVAKVSSDAHKAIMKEVRPGMMEYQAEAIFLKHSYFVGGCRHASYTCICGSGNNSSVLHYGHGSAPNDKQIQAGDMLLFDMGANYFGYASDITCSFPVNGSFTEDQKLIYNAVFRACRAVHDTAKAGASWVALHRLANTTLLEALIKIGLLKGDSNDMMKAGINGIFQPHGLGHLLGMDVHDVGGYDIPGCPPRPTEPGLTSLRFARQLEAGMYITIEPGCYFIDHLLDSALNDPVQKEFFVPEVLKRFRNFGGIRIEDNVLVTENGVEDFTAVPRTVEDIEQFMRVRK